MKPKPTAAPTTSAGGRVTRRNLRSAPVLPTPSKPAPGGSPPKATNVGRAAKRSVPQIGTVKPCSVVIRKLPESDICDAHNDDGSSSVHSAAKKSVPHIDPVLDDDAQCRHFGVKRCSVVIRKLSESDICDATKPQQQQSTVVQTAAHNDDGSSSLRMPRCSVRLLSTKAPAAEESALPTPPTTCRSPSPQYSPICTPQSHRSRSSTPIDTHHHVPVYKSITLGSSTTPAAAASAAVVANAAAATSSPSNRAPGANVYDFMNLSQEDDTAAEQDDQMREVIAKLQTANRIKLVHKRRGGKLGIAASSKPKMKRAPAAQTQKELQQWRQLRTLVKKTAAAASGVGSVAAAAAAEVAAVAAKPHPLPPPPPPPLSAIHRRLLAAAAHLKPMTQSTPIRSTAPNGDVLPPPPFEPFPPPTMHASTPIVQNVAGPQTASKGTVAAAGAASPWRVTDDHIPSTSYFCTSLSDQLPSYSSDMLTAATMPPPPPLQPPLAAPLSVAKRPAEEALAAAMETQKRPKLHTAADGGEQQQKRLNFSAEISPPAQTTDDDTSLQVTPSFTSPPPTSHLQPSTSAVAATVESPALQLLHNSDIENVQPPNHIAQLAAAKVKATRVVLGERGKGADRMPLQPLAIRNVYLSSPPSTAKRTSSATFNVRSSDEQSPPDYGMPMPRLRLDRLPVDVTKQQQQGVRTPQQQQRPQDSISDVISLNSSSDSPINRTCNEKTPPDHTKATSVSNSTMRPQLNQSLAECFGFDIGDSSDGDENRCAPIVKNPLAIRARMQGLQRHVPAVRRSGPRRMDTPIRTGTQNTRTVGRGGAAAAAAAAGLFRDPERPGATRCGAIQQSLRQQSERQRGALAADDAATTTMDGADDGDNETVTAVTNSFQSFVRGVAQPKERVDAAEVGLFEARWPEQHKPNRKSYTRQPRKRFCYREVDTDEEDEEEEDEADLDLSTGEQRKKARIERLAQRKKAEEAHMAIELEKFADEFNSMVEDVEQFDVILEKSA